MSTVAVHLPHWTGRADTIGLSPFPALMELGAADLEAEVSYWRRVAEGLAVTYRTWERRLDTEVAAAYRSLMLGVDAFAQQHADASLTSRLGHRRVGAAAAQGGRRQSGWRDELWAAWQSHVRDSGFPERVNRALAACRLGYWDEARRLLQQQCDQPDQRNQQHQPDQQNQQHQPDQQNQQGQRSATGRGITGASLDVDTTAGSFTGMGAGLDSGSASSSLELVSKTLGVASAVLPAALGVAAGPVGWGLVGLEQACQGMATLARRVGRKRQLEAGRIRRAILRGLQRQEQSWRSQLNASLQSLHHALLTALAEQLQVRWERLAAEAPGLCWLWEQPAVQAHWEAYRNAREMIAAAHDESESIAYRLLCQQRIDLIEQAAVTVSGLDPSAKLGPSGHMAIEQIQTQFGEWVQQRVRQTVEEYQQALSQLKPRVAGIAAAAAAKVAVPATAEAPAGAATAVVALADRVLARGDAASVAGRPGRDWRWLLRAAGLFVPPLGVAVQLGEVQRELRGCARRGAILAAAKQAMAQAVARAEADAWRRLEQLREGYLASAESAARWAWAGVTAATSTVGGPSTRLSAELSARLSTELSAKLSAELSAKLSAELSTKPSARLSAGARAEMVQWRRGAALLEALAIATVATTHPVVVSHWKQAV